MPMRKVALVTGAGSGIGKASALSLMRNSFSVVLNGRRKEPLEAASMEGRAFGAEAIALTTVKRTEFGLADACCVLKDCRKYLLEVAG